MVQYNNVHREYDIAFTEVELLRVRKLREHPMGEYHKLRLHQSTGQYIYPWKKMSEGDFFLVPITESNYKAKKVQMLQAARRYDYEISMVKVLDPDKNPALRVTFTYFGVKRIRNLAKLHHNKSGAISDGKWQKRRQRYRKQGRHTS